MYGFIYKITFPNEKSYIGQVQEYVGKRFDYKGINGRIKNHISSAKRNNDKGCRLLNNAIRKYGSDTLKVEKLIKCDLSNLDLFEELFIKTHNTFVPNGYNLQSGGTFTKHSKNTCEKRSNSLKQLLESDEKRKVWSECKKGPQKNKRVCKVDRNNGLPKYIYLRTDGNNTRYVVEHPNGTKSFGKNKYTIEERFSMAKEYLDSISRMQFND